LIGLSSDHITSSDVYRTLSARHEFALVSDSPVSSHLPNQQKGSTLTSHLSPLPCQAERDEARQQLDRKDRDILELKDEHRAAIEETKVLPSLALLLSTCEV